jgi:outer membrane protein assembly factor BamB
MNMNRILLSMLLLVLSTSTLQGLECLFFPTMKTFQKQNNTSNEDWPFYGLNNANWRNPKENIISKNNVDELSVKWTFTTLGPMVGHPSIVDNVAYFADALGFVYAANAATGDLIWQTLLSNPPFSNPTYQLSAPFFDIPGVALAPTVHGSRVFVLTFNAFLIALDKNTGAILQSTLLQDDPIYPQSGLTSVGILEPNDQIVAALSTFEPQQLGLTDTSSGRIYSFKASDLDVQLWKLATSQNPSNPLTNGGSGVGIWAPLAYDQQLNIIYQGTGNNWMSPITPIADSLLALNASTGEIAWHIQYTNDDIAGIPNPCSPTGVSGKNWDLGMAAILVTYTNDDKKINAAIVGSKSGMLHAVNRKTGDRLWDIVLTNPNPDGSGFGGVNTSGCSDGEVVYVPSHYSSDGLPLEASFSASSHMATGIFAIRARDGAILWRIDVPGMTVGPLTVANEVLYHTSFDGILRAINAKNGQVLFEFTAPIGTHFSGGTSVHNGKVYVPTGALDNFTTNYLIVLGL